VLAQREGDQSIHSGQNRAGVDRSAGVAGELQFARYPHPDDDSVSERGAAEGARNACARVDDKPEVRLQRGERPAARVVADQTGSPTSAADIAAAVRAAVQQLAAGNTNRGTCQKPILRSTFRTG
jgi:RmlD substrate binding domain